MKRFLIACLVPLLTACVHASALDDRLRQLNVPASARVAPWRGVADRTLVAWLAPSPDPTLDYLLDLRLLVLSTRDGYVVANTTMSGAYPGTWRAQDIQLVASNFELAAGMPSFAVDSFEQQRHPCLTSDATARAVYELDGGEIRRVLDGFTLATHTTFCDSAAVEDAHGRLLPMKTRNAGHVDLDREVEISRIDCDEKQRCVPAGPFRSGLLLRFDGKAYVPAGYVTSPPR